FRSRAPPWGRSSSAAGLLPGPTGTPARSAAATPLAGRIEGFGIDIPHETSRALFGDPDRIHFRAMTNAERIPAIVRGEVDIVAHSMTITCERMEQVLFSTDYPDSGQRVLVAGQLRCAVHGRPRRQAGALRRGDGLHRGDGEAPGRPRSGRGQG